MSSNLPEKQSNEGRFAAPEGRLGVEHRNLEGWIPAMATEEETRAALEKALDFRGDVTITRKDGTVVEGYIFDRRAGATLAECVVRLFPIDRDEKVTISYADIAALAFTGRDAAAGRSWETWIKKYAEKKAAGEKNIGIESEKLD
jgi:hypothetical protein